MKDFIRWVLDLNAQANPVISHVVGTMMLLLFFAAIILGVWIFLQVLVLITIYPLYSLLTAVVSFLVFGVYLYDQYAKSTREK